MAPLPGVCGPRHGSIPGVKSWDVTLDKELVDLILVLTSLMNPVPGRTQQVVLCEQA